MHTQLIYNRMQIVRNSCAKKKSARAQTNVVNWSNARTKTVHLTGNSKLFTAFIRSNGYRGAQTSSEFFYCHVVLGHADIPWRMQFISLIIANYHVAYVSSFKPHRSACVARALTLFSLRFCRRVFFFSGNRAKTKRIKCYWYYKKPWRNCMEPVICASDFNKCDKFYVFVSFSAPCDSFAAMPLFVSFLCS